MKKTFVVTEGEDDRLILTALLQPGNNLSIVAAGSRSAADSLARSYMINGGNDVALVVGASTRDAGEVEAGKRFLERSLADVATRSEWRVFVPVPELEIIFFDNRPVLEALVGGEVADSDFLEGKFEPKQTLRRLLGEKSLLDAYKGVLPYIDVEPLRRHPTIEQLQRFLDIVGRKDIAARKAAA